MVNDKLKQEMFILLGLLEALRFPIMWSGNEDNNQAYYDLIDSVRDRYVAILKDVAGLEV